MNAAPLSSLTPVLPDIVLAVGALVLLMLGAFRARSEAVISTLSVVLLLVAAVIVACVPGGHVFGGSFIVDDFARFMKILAYVCSAFAIVMSDDFFVAEREQKFEYPILIVISSVGMGMLISAGDLIALYLGLELMSLALYVVAASSRDNVRSTEAGLKYFVLGALSSGMLLYGCSLIYGFTGNVSFIGIAKASGQGGIGLVFGLVFLFVGFCFKVSAVPFHMWTPDVYEGAPTPVTAFFASAPKVAAVLLVVRLSLDALGPAIEGWRQIMTFAALASIFLGAIAAYGQNNIKRLLAYSSINNVGFALIGLVAGGVAGASSVLFYMAVYVVMTLGAFLCVQRMRNAAGEPVETIDSLSGLSQSRPGLAAAFAIFMFSLAGIPPLFGFWPKLMVFNAAVAEGLYPLAVAGILGTVVGAFYYLKIIKTMYMDAPGEPYAKSGSGLETAFIALAAILVSPLGYLLIGPLGRLTQSAAGSLF
jgi:NADH-quinone oxidoreductase subunit N